MLYGLTCVFATFRIPRAKKNIAFVGIGQPDKFVGVLYLWQGLFGAKYVKGSSKLPCSSIGCVVGTLDSKPGVGRSARSICAPRV